MKKLVLLSVALMVIMSITCYALEVNVALGKTYTVDTPFTGAYSDSFRTILTDGDTTYALSSVNICAWPAVQSPRRVNIDLGQILPSIDSVAITNFVAQGSGVRWIFTGEVWGSSAVAGAPYNYAFGIVPTVDPPLDSPYNIATRFTDNITPIIGGYNSCVGWATTGPIKVATLDLGSAKTDILQASIYCGYEPGSGIGLITTARVYGSSDTTGPWNLWGDLTANPDTTNYWAPNWKPPQTFKYTWFGGPKTARYVKFEMDNAGEWLLVTELDIRGGPFTRWGNISAADTTVTEGNRTYSWTGSPQSARYVTVEVEPIGTWDILALSEIGVYASQPPTISPKIWAMKPNTNKLFTATGGAPIGGTHYIWSSNSTAVGYFADTTVGLFTAVGIGSATITVTDADGLFDTAVVTVAPTSAPMAIEPEATIIYQRKLMPELME